MPRHPNPTGSQFAKLASQRARRNKTSTRTEVYVAPPSKIGLPLRDDGKAWHPLTQSMWDLLWASPIVNEYSDNEIAVLMRVARLDHDFWMTSDSMVAARLALAINTLTRNLGLDPMSRRSLQWTLKPPSEDPRNVTPPAVSQAHRDPRLQSLPSGQETPAQRRYRARRARKTLAATA